MCVWSLEGLEVAEECKYAIWLLDFELRFFFSLVSWNVRGDNLEKWKFSARVEEKII